VDSRFSPKRSGTSKRSETRTRSPLSGIRVRQRRRGEKRRQGPFYIHTTAPQGPSECQITLTVQNACGSIQVLRRYPIRFANSLSACPNTTITNSKQCASEPSYQVVERIFPPEFLPSRNSFALRNARRVGGCLFQPVLFLSSERRGKLIYIHIDVHGGQIPRSSIPSGTSASQWPSIQVPYD